MNENCLYFDRLALFHFRTNVFCRHPENHTNPKIWGLYYFTLAQNSNIPINETIYFFKITAFLPFFSHN